MNKDVALRSEFLPQTVLDQIEQVSSKLIESKALPSSILNGAQLTMVLMAGYEAGMKPMESINAYYIINGRLTIYGDASIRQLRRADYKIKWDESTDKTATVTLSKGSESHTETYTIEEATKAGLLSKIPWKNHPKDMLRWKCVARAIRFFCPEVLGGVQYFKEEAEDFDPEKREPVHVEASEAPVSVQPDAEVTLAKAEIVKPEDFGKCEKCDGRYHRKNSPKGELLACSNYPKCTSMKPLPKLDSVVSKAADNIASA
jgi:hypothetical protein